ncbi:hypothetical protein BLNAU_8471 [Blattamonas nauphoetae]|uniref:Uncharacterized protein n=1 Tax=Blattamonas nauphoetae TaxID=2049346 RepID=A0ABQ9XYQ4_9EUKA|nr:hypothetical protein BLNAU_8471 [Blattamonas nauphoetae]
MSVKEDDVNSRSLCATGSTHAPDSGLTVQLEHTAFLNLDSNSHLSFEDKSTLYCSLVSLVQSNHIFDEALQDKTVKFLENLKPGRTALQLANQIISKLVPSPDTTQSRFIDSIYILVSSPHTKIVSAALAFLEGSFMSSSKRYKTQVFDVDFVPRILSIIQPHTLTVSGNENLFCSLNHILSSSINLAHSRCMDTFGITEPPTLHNRREIIFQRHIQPLSQYLSFLCSNRYFFATVESSGGMQSLLGRVLQISPFHHPTLEFVLASPIVMTIPSFLSFVEHSGALWNILADILYLMCEWKKHSTEVAQSGKRMIRALLSDGMEDTLEQLLLSNQNCDFSGGVVLNCVFVLRLLGWNKKSTEQ